MRIWKNNAPDDGSIHCLGNGHLCAYEQGPNLIQVFGPPYSSPSLYRLVIDAAQLPATGQIIETRSERAPGTAIWTHHVLCDGRATGEMVDFVDAYLPCLVRHVKLSVPMRFLLDGAPRVQAIFQPQRFAEVGGDGGLLLEAPAGLYIYHTYPYPSPIVHQLAWRGAVHVSVHGTGNAADITCGPGEGWLYCVGGPDYPSCAAKAEAALRIPPAQLLSRTQHWWHGVSEGWRGAADAVPAGAPQRDRILQAVDSVGVLIKVQQSAEGAVLAGHAYHMGYVRDQYGVGRGLLALGMTSAARKILEFYWSVWQRHGAIHNAQAAGIDGVFHVHENDDVEITGYLIRQAFDLAQATGDIVFLDAIFPMLEWAWQAQKKHLVLGMLPFNGDETYIAGGMLPRHTINDGSAEATLLFIDGGEKLLDHVEQSHRWPAQELAADRGLLAAVKAAYRGNFWRDGRLIANNPARAAAASPPRFRHGVCERCQAEGRHRGIVWTERNQNGRYVCPQCLALAPYPAAEPREYALQSVSLLPIYYQSSFFTPGELAPLVSEIAERYQQTGRLPSRQDAAPTALARSVGYDYGLLLYALTELRHPLAAELCEKMLSLIDATGAWVEYYANDRPQGTRYRPWESAINLEAALHWARLRER